jgi:hypothetical protein
MALGTLLASADAGQRRPVMPMSGFVISP